MKGEKNHRKIPMEKMAGRAIQEAVVEVIGDHQRAETKGFQTKILPSMLNGRKMGMLSSWLIASEFRKEPSFYPRIERIPSGKDLKLWRP